MILTAMSKETLVEARGVTDGKVVRCTWRKGRRTTIPAETNSNDFLGFWNQLADSNSIFVAVENFFERFDFLVCSKFNHKQCGRTCACAVACLCPRNSISNVVASVTIHDDMYIFV